MIIQKEITLSSKPRGFHLITNEILDNISEIKNMEVGLMNILIKHTSASLTINEDADPLVRKDFENYFNKFIPEGEDYYTHTGEGDDDMPAHLKTSVLGCSLNIPIKKGQLNLGTWQGIYLCEHRNRGGNRNIVITIIN
ncbi:MAG: secondary thiamine-phosphate synthase enzyme YjbQ [gamma proteobacterium symbiont of Taylorina sp.]|nr:secondary thiamine-phosphate synthase enzyme YjbQ [gamma proteobacterium symbiont of Taylorina sp.]